MSVLSDFIEYRKQKKILKLKNAVKDTYFSSEENPIDESVKLLKTFIINNPEKTTDLYEQIFSDSDIPNRIISKTTTDLIKNSDERDAKIASIEGITDIGEKLNDEIIKDVISVASNSPDIDKDHEIQIANQFNDIKEKQSYVHDRLKTIYTNMDSSKNDYILCNELTDLRSILTEQEGNNYIFHTCKSITDWEYKNIAKKIALNYSHLGISQLEYLSKIVPFKKMLQINMPKLVNNEYNLLAKKQKANHPYHPSELKNKILKEIAKDIALQYDENGELLVPQSDQMKKLTSKEETLFVDTIKQYSRKNISEQKIFAIKQQIHGMVIPIDNIERITSLLTNLPEAQQNLLFKQIRFLTTQPNFSNVLNIMQQEGLFDSFSNMEEKDIRTSLSTIKNTLDIYNKNREVTFPNTVDSHENR